MRRFLVAAICSTLVALPIGSAEVSATGTRSATYRYVAKQWDDPYVSGAAIFDTRAALGEVRFVTRSSTFSLRVDEDARVGWLVAVDVSSLDRNKVFAAKCIASGTSHTFRGALAGERISVEVIGTPWSAWFGCQPGGTTGTLTVVT